LIISIEDNSVAHLLRSFTVTRARGKVLRRVADKLSLVYFGTVDHTSDEHDVIRGLTVSTSHKDKHFTVGTYDGYDIALVDRYDKQHNWGILQVSLRNDRAVPHLFFLPKQREAHFADRFSGTRFLASINQFTSLPQPQDFSSRYELLVAPQYAHSVEHLLSPHFLHGVAAHFWPHALELKDGKLFVYITEHRLDETVLLSSIESALWLADAIDTREN
jgi:hypothetical protein